MSDFNEKDHPRDKDGKFVDKNGDVKVKAQKVADNIQFKRLDHFGNPIKDKSKDNSNSGQDAIDYLRQKHPSDFKPKVVKIDMTTEIQKAITDAKTPNEQRDIIFDYIMNEMRGVYKTGDGVEVTISYRTAKEYTHNAIEVKLRIAPQLAEILKHSEFIGIVDAEHKRYKKFMYYKTNFDINGKIHSAKINIGITLGNKAVLYEINQFRE